MTLSAAAIILALILQTPSEDTLRAASSNGPVPPDTVDVPGDSYADSTASALMAATRAYAEATKSDIEAYRLTSRYALSIGLSTGRRDRLLYKREMAWRVSWRRDVEWRVDVLGAREQIPLVRSAPEVGDPDDEIGTLDPDFIIGNRGQWLLRLPTSGDTSNAVFHHPLAPGAEYHYRFSTGDSTRIQLPGHGSLTLIEMKVTPRRASSDLLSGSWWFDASTAAPVRAALRLASPARFDLDSSARFLPALGQASFDIDYLTLEYALWEGRWWLPKLISLQGRGRIGGIQVPLLVEQTFEEIELFATNDDWAPLPPPDTLMFRPEGEGRESAEDEDEENEDVVDDDAPGTPPAVDEPGREEAGLVRELFVLRSDSALVTSDLLPESTAAIGSVLSSRDLDEINAALDAALPIAGRGLPEIGWSLLDPGLLRYNRVEGLSIGSSVIARYGPFSLDGAFRIGIAGPTPSAEIGVRKARPEGSRELRAYSRIQPFTPRDRPLALGNSVSTLLLGRDEGDYFRASGLSAMMGRRLSRWNRSELSLTLFAEQQAPLEQNATWSLRGGDHLRPNPAADRASQMGFDALLESRFGVQADHFRGGVSAGLRGETGSFDFIRWSISSNVGFPLPGPLLGSIEAATGQIAGSPSLQSVWYLGGPSTVRGFAPEERIAGKTFWRGRGEIATEEPGLRGILFIDAGSAGEMFMLDGPRLMSVGVGISAIDGIFRADVARALRGGSGWGLQLYLDAPL